MKLIQCYATQQCTQARKAKRLESNVFLRWKCRDSKDKCSGSKCGISVRDLNKWFSGDWEKFVEKN
jgi:hypothetical protein